jgi:hypothetical protein
VWLLTPCFIKIGVQALFLNIEHIYSRSVIIAMRFHTALIYPLSSLCSCKIFHSNSFYSQYFMYVIFIIARFLNAYTLIIFTLCTSLHTKGDDLTTFIVPKSGALTYCIPKGLLRPVAGKLYFALISLHTTRIFERNA